VNDRAYSRSPDVLWRNVGTDVILTRPHADTIAELSRSGADVWRMLEHKSSAREVAAELAGYSHGAAEIETGVRVLLDDLVWRGYCIRDDR
jgi:coenzyme PQQ synthesis protein D (PqqD)